MMSKGPKRRKKRNLVIGHLESVSRTILEKHQKQVRQYVKGRNGIYALYRKNRLYYVGLASNLRGRLRHHLNDRHASSWDRFSIYLTRSLDHMKELESLLLRVVDPIGNRQLGKLPGSRDLKPGLKQEMLGFFHSELEEMLGGKDKTTARKKRTKSKRRPAKRRNELTSPFKKRTKIRSLYKDKTYSGYIRKDGKVQVSGKLYSSLSAAGAVITKRSTNGWRFWRYKNRQGEWVRLKDLKK